MLHVVIAKICYDDSVWIQNNLYNYNKYHLNVEKKNKIKT